MRQQREAILAFAVDYSTSYLLLATTLLLGLTLAILLGGINALTVPPPWVPTLLYSVVVGFLIVSVLGTLIQYARRLQRMPGGARSVELRTHLRGTKGAILGCGALSTIVLGPIAIVWSYYPPSFDWMRLAYGIGLTPASFANLTALGYTAGAILLVLPVLACTCCCCRFLEWPVTGRPRRRALAASAAPGARTPFVDLVENKSTIPLLSPLLFVYGFALPTSFVLAGSILLGPEAVMRSPSSPASLSPLCRAAVPSLLVPLAQRYVGDLALAWSLYDAQWRQRFEPLPDVCGGDVPIVTSVRVPVAGPANTTLSLVVRDAHSIGVPGVSIDAALVRWAPEAGAAPHLSMPVVTAQATPTGPSGVAEVQLSVLEPPDGWGASAWPRAVLTFNVSTRGCGESGEHECIAATGAATHAQRQCEMLHRQVRLLLFRPSSAVARAAYTLPLDTDDPGQSVSVRVESSVDAVVTTSSVVRRATASNGTLGDGNQSLIELNTTVVRTPLLSLTIVTPPPLVLTVREVARATLLLTTDAGLPVAGQRVEAAVLAPRGTRVRLRSEGASAFTDANGTATLHLCLEAGVNGTYSVLFLSEAVSRSAALASAMARDQAMAWAGLVTSVLESSPDPLAFVSEGSIASFGLSSLRAAASSRASSLLAPVHACSAAAAEGAAADACVRAALAAVPSFGSVVLDGLADQADTPSTALESASLAALLPLVLSRDAGAVVGDVAASLVKGAIFFSATRAVDELAGQALDAAAEMALADAQLLVDLVRLGGGLELFAQFPLPRPRPFELHNPIAAAELSAPIVGFAAAASGAATVSASALSSCPLEGYARYTPSVPVVAADSLNLLGAPAVPDEPLPLLWQPWPFSLLNFVIDREDFTSMAPAMCRESYLGDGMQAPQPMQLRQEGAATAVRFGPDPYPITTEALGGLDGLSALFEREGFEFDPRRDCDASGAHDALLSRLDSSAGLGTVARALRATGWNGCRARRFGARRDPSARVPRRLFRAVNRVRVLNQTGGVLSGRRCEVAVDPALEWLRLRVEHECSEEEDSPGTYSLRQLVLHGGASRERAGLRLLVDGVEAKLAADSWWAEDVRVEYISQEQLSFRSSGVLFLVGHDAFYVLAVIAMPLFALNTPGLRANSLPSMATRLFGALACCLILWYQRMLDVFTVGDREGERACSIHSLAALGTNDLTPMGYRTASGLAFWAMTFCATLAYILFVLFLRLFASWLVWGTLPLRAPKTFSRWRRAWEMRQRQPGSRERWLGWLGLGPDPLWQTPNGRLEPAQFFESEAQRRRRLARNHVRLLLRGQAALEQSFAAHREHRLREWKASWRAAALQLASGAASSICRSADRVVASAARATPTHPDNRSGSGSGGSDGGDGGGDGSAGAAPPHSSSEPEHGRAPLMARAIHGAQRRRRALEGSVSVALERSEFHQLRGATLSALGYAQNEWRAYIAEQAEAARARELRAFLDDRAAFIFPQRLRLARALSIWICLMLTLVMLNLVEWAVGAIDFSAAVHVQLAEQARHTDQLEAATQLSAGPLQLLLVLARSELAKSESTRQIIVPIMLWLLRAAAAAALLVTGLNWHLIFHGFRRHVLRMRRGDLFVERSDRLLGVDLVYNEFGANKFIGYQVSHTTFGFLLMVSFLLLLVTPLVPIVLSAVGVIKDDGRLFQGALEALGALLRTVGILLIPVGLQLLANKFFFFRRTWIQDRALYAFYDYNLTYANALLGLLSVASRLVLLVFSFVLYFPRIDRTSMPGPSGNLAVLDAGFNSYMAFLLMEHRYNAPVVVAFCELLIERLEVERARRRIRAVMGGDSAGGVGVDIEEELGSKLGAGGPRARVDPTKGGRRRSIVGTIDAPTTRWQRAAGIALAWGRARRRRVLNRWRLALFLLENPSVRSRRWHVHGHAEMHPELRTAKATARELAAYAERRRMETMRL